MFAPLPDNPTVTIFTPVYNQQDYIAETVESVLAQDYPSIQHVVIDDGSTDDTLKVLERYADRIEILRHRNMGQYATVNEAFTAARGEIAGIVNSDDPLLPGAVSRLVRELVEHPEAVVVYPDWNMIDPVGEVIRTERTYDYSYANMVRWFHCFPGPAAFFRREVFETLQGRDPSYRYIADLDFWLRAGLLGPFRRVPEVLATFRLHPGSITCRKGLEMAEENLLLVRDYFARAQLPDEIRVLEREALCSAYYNACGLSSKSSLLKAMQFMVHSLLLCPLKYLGEYRPRLGEIVKGVLRLGAGR